MRDGYWPGGPVGVGDAFFVNQRQSARCGRVSGPGVAELRVVLPGGLVWFIHLARS